jgi:hypothetical protein
MTLMVDGGMWKAALNDRDGEVVAFVSGVTLTDLMDAINRGLDEGSLAWRVKKPFVPTNGKK